MTSTRRAQRVNAQSMDGLPNDLYKKHGMLWSLNTNCKSMKVVQHLPYKLMTSGSYQLCFAKAQENLQVFPVSGYPRRWASATARKQVSHSEHLASFKVRLGIPPCTMSSLTSCQQLNTLCNKALLLASGWVSFGITPWYAATELSPWGREQYLRELNCGVWCPWD